MTQHEQHCYEESVFGGLEGVFVHEGSLYALVFQSDMGVFFPG